MAEQRPICEDCDYDLSGIRADERGMVTCPECGREWVAEHLGGTQRWPNAVDMLLLTCGPFLICWAIVGALGNQGALRETVSGILLLCLLPIAFCVPVLMAWQLARCHSRRSQRWKLFLAAALFGVTVNALLYFVLGVLIT